MNYGCCRDGLACGLTTCYENITSSVEITLVLTTTNISSHYHTITTVVETAYVPSTINSVPTTTSQLTVAKISATYSSSATSSATETPSPGLKNSQLGGIIGGAVAAFIIILLLAVLILRRLSTVVRRTEARKSDFSSPNISGTSSNQLNPNTSVEPLLTHGEGRFVAATATSNPENFQRQAQQSESYSYFPPYASAMGYHALSESDLAMQSQTSPPPDVRDQNLRFGHPTPSLHSRPSINSHGRQWSDVSEQSNQSNESYELDAGVDGARRASLQRALAGFGLVLGRRSSRRQSNSSGRIDNFENSKEWMGSVHGKLDSVGEGPPGTLRNEKGHDR
jgi:hypothetical protein